MRFKTLQYCPSSVAAADKSRHRTLSDLYLLVPRQTSFPLPLFSRLSVSAFYRATVCVSKLFNADTAPLRRQTIKAPYTVRPLSSGSRQTSFPLPLFSRLSASAFYRATVCVSKLFNTDTAPLRQQINQGAVHCPAFVFPVSGKPLFPFRSFLAFRFPLFYCTTVCVSKLFNTAPAPLRRQTNQDAVHCSAFIFLFPGTQRPVLRDISLTEAII